MPFRALRTLIEKPPLTCIFVLPEFVVCGLKTLNQKTNPDKKPFSNFLRLYIITISTTNITQIFKNFHA